MGTGQVSTDSGHFVKNVRPAEEKLTLAFLSVENPQFFIIPTNLWQ